MNEDTIDACCQIIEDRIDELKHARIDAHEEGWPDTLAYGIAQLEGVRWTIKQMKEQSDGV